MDNKVDDPVSHYLESYNHTKGSVDAIERLLSTVNSMSSVMGLGLSHTSVQGPFWKRKRKDQTFISYSDFSHWPSREKLQASFKEWIQSREHLDDAWAAVPAERRIGLKAPETLD